MHCPRPTVSISLLAYILMTLRSHSALNGLRVCELASHFDNSRKAAIAPHVIKLGNQSRGTVSLHLDHMVC